MHPHLYVFFVVVIICIWIYCSYSYWGSNWSILGQRRFIQMKLIMGFQKVKFSKLFTIRNLFFEVCASKCLKLYTRQCSSSWVQAINAIRVNKRERNQWEILGEALREAVGDWNTIRSVRFLWFPFISYLSKLWCFLHTNSHMSLILELGGERGQPSNKWTG